MKKKQDLDKLIGWIVFACLFIGVVGLLGAFSDRSDSVGGAIYLTASALAFGLLANAILRVKEATMDFSSKRVLVTGGSRGIGREVAKAFAGHGARVAVHDKTNREAALEQQ